MTTGVNELAPGDIDRSGAGISTGGQQPQGFREDGGQQAAAPMGQEQQAAIAHIGELRRQAGDPSINSAKRDGLMKQLSELSRYAFTGAAKPSWFGEQELDARATSSDAYDPMAAEVAGASDTLTDGQHAQLATDGKIFGLDAAGATEAANFCKAAGLDPTTAKIVVKRFAQHAQHGWGTGVLTEAEQAELGAELVTRFGSSEKVLAESALAEAYLQKMGLSDWAEKHGGSVIFDPVVLSMLALKARQTGIKVAA